LNQVDNGQGAIYNERAIDSAIRHCLLVKYLR